MNVPVFYAGLDVGSRVCALAVVDGAGKPRYSSEFATSERALRSWVGEARKRCAGELHLALEEGEMAHWVAQMMRSEVTRVVVCDPKRNRWIAKDSTKRDKLDALKLAQLLRGNYVNEVYHTPDDDRMEFRRVVQEYHRLTQIQADYKRRIRAQFRMRGVFLRACDVFPPDARETALALLADGPPRQIVQQLYRLLDVAEREQQNAQELMVGLGRKFPQVERFQAVPGIGPIWACTFFGIVQTAERFAHRRKLVRYARLGVTDRSSDGQPLGYPRLDRQGVGLLKHLSYRAFCAARKGKNEISRYYEECLKRTGDAVGARLSTQRKILATLYGMWKHDEPYRPEMVNQPARPAGPRRVKVYQLRPRRSVEQVPEKVLDRRNEERKNPVDTLGRA